MIDTTGTIENLICVGNEEGITTLLKGLYEYTEDAAVWDGIKTAQDLVNTPADKLVPSVFRHIYTLEDQTTMLARNMIRMDYNLGKMNGKVATAIGIGLAACAVGGYLWAKVKGHEERINRLEETAVRYNRPNYTNGL